MKLKILILINILAVILFYLFVNLATITQVSPSGDILQRSPEFRWEGLPIITYTLLIDDNADFSTPIVAKVKGNTYVPEQDLAAGTYYWKVIGFKETGVQKFTITPTVSLKRESIVTLRNDGNVVVKLDMKPKLTGAAVLEIDKVVKLENETTEVSARQYE